MNISPPFSMNLRLDLYPLLSNCQIFPTFAVYNQNVETMTYLDPKADLTFKKVFGEHEELVKSLLNALLPFQTPEEEIQTLEYRCCLSKRRRKKSRRWNTCLRN